MAAGNIKEIEEFQTAQMNYQLRQKTLNSDIALLSLERECGDIENPKDFKNQLKEIKLRSKSLREDLNQRTALHVENMSKYQAMIKQKVYVKQEANEKVKKEIVATVRKTLFEGTSPAVNDITKLSDSVSISNSSSSSPYVNVQENLT